DIDLLSFNNSNYELTRMTPGKLTITAAGLEATVQDASREYKSADPAFAADFIGLKEGDDKAVLKDLEFRTDAQFSSPVAGSPYDIDLLSFNNSNYELTRMTPGKLTITAAPLTLNINDTSRKIGEPNPTFDGIIEGFKYGETPSALGDRYFDTNADSESLPGDNPYRIWFSGFQNSENPNYVFTNVREGQLTVESGIFLKNPEDVPRGNSAKPSVPDQGNTPQNQTDNSAAASSGSNTDAFGAPVFASQARRQGLAGQEDLLFSNGGNRELWGPSINR
ncbi:MAG: MBG domain-containing protein, partial [Desulfosarcina sp.]